MSPILSYAIPVALGCYGVAMAVSVIRVLRGPAAQDRILALDFMYLIGALVMLVLGIQQTSEVYFEAALLVALLGFVSSAALAKFLLRGEVIE